MKRIICLLSFLFLLSVSVSVSARSMDCSRDNWNKLLDMRNDYSESVNVSLNEYGKFFYYIRDNRSAIYSNESQASLQNSMDILNSNYSNDSKFGRKLLRRAKEFLDGCVGQDYRREARNMARDLIENIKEMREYSSKQSDYLRDYSQDFIDGFEESLEFHRVLSN